MTALDSAITPLLTESEAFALNASSQTSSAVTQPLYQPRPSDAYAPPLSTALSVAREVLAEQQGANIHDPLAMVRAATALEGQLRRLVAALDADASGVAA